jgi:UDP-glucose 4-epimerase
VAGGNDPDPTRLVPRALAAATNSSPLTINGDGSTTRDYLHIRDAAESFVACIDHPPAKGRLVRYNIGSGHGNSVMDVVAAVQKATGRTIELEHRPFTAEPPELVNDPSKAIMELGWLPQHSSIEMIIRDTGIGQAAGRH